MSDDQNTDRNARQPCDIPASELQGEIDAAVKKLWDTGFHTQIGSVIQQATDARKARLSALLGRQADEQTRRIVSLTRWIVGLTIGLGLLTIGLLVATLVLLRIASHTDERVRQIHEIAEAQRHQAEKTDTSTPQKDRISR